MSKFISHSKVNKCEQFNTGPSSVSSPMCQVAALTDVNIFQQITVEYVDNKHLVIVYNSLHSDITRNTFMN